VWEVLVLYYEGDADEVLWTLGELEEEFGVKKGTLSDIVYGRTWKDLHAEFWESE
jgi:hypothetical protein